MAVRMDCEIGVGVIGVTSPCDVGTGVGNGTREVEGMKVGSVLVGAGGRERGEEGGGNQVNSISHFQYIM